MKCRFPFKSILLFSLIICATLQSSQAGATKHFDLLGPVEFFSSPAEQPFATMIKTLNKAQKEIRLMAFHLTDESIVQALLDAKTRGVRVRVIAERFSLLDSRTRKAKKKLIAGGVEFVKSSKFFTVTHMKSFIVDAEYAMISTMNLHETSKHFIDFGVITQNQDVISEMISVFDTDWKNAMDHGGETPNLRTPSLLFSPVNAKKKLMDLILSAQKSIIVGVENLDHPEIIGSLIEVHQRNVKVQVMTPACTIGSTPEHNIQFVQQLKDAGIDGRVLPKPSDSGANYWHAKIVIVDNEVLYLGSENFSENSLEKAREVGLIFKDSEVLSKIKTRFEQSWKSAVSPDAVQVNGSLWCK